MRAAPGLYPVREIPSAETRAAFLVLAGPYGVEPEDLQEAEEAFVDRVDNVMRPDGYRLAGAFPPESEIASAVAGFRLVRSNVWGDHILIDDFVAAGVGSETEVLRLLHFLEDEAGKLGVTQIHLDIIPPELATDGPKEVSRRSFGAEVDDLAELIEGADDYEKEDDGIDPDSPVGNRVSASECGFLYVAQRHILIVDNTASDQGSPTKAEKPVLLRRPLGRPLPPRRGH